MGIQVHTPGHVRYFTYYLHFPDGDTWCNQVPFVHDLFFELRRTAFVKKNPAMARDILVNGECHWKDHNGVEHRVVVENEKREKVWGTRSKRGMPVARRVTGFSN